MSRKYLNSNFHIFEKVEKNQRYLFDLLLFKVGKKLQESHPEVNLPMTNWKGEEITLLREDLQEKVLGSISEKWFYTHIKNQQEKLPRVDTLNLFANYIGEQSWKAFLYKYSNSELKKNIPSNKKENPRPSNTHKKKFILLTVFGSFILFALLIFIYSTQKNDIKYQFCFLDKNTHLPVVDSFLEVKIIKNNETPLFYPLESNCLHGIGDKVEFIIKGRFYKPIQIKRIIQNESYQESIFLEPDDYTMMLHLFANSKVKDWKKRRSQLAEMMHDNLKAYEISNDGFTIDILNKKEFINKMTLPTRGLKKVAIVSTHYKEDQVSLIKFTQE